MELIGRTSVRRVRDGRIDDLTEYWN